MRQLVLAGAAAAALAGCAAPADTGLPDVARIVGSRMAQRIDADQDGTLVAALLSRTLGPEDAVQVALLRNRGLRADYAALGLAQADLVQAGLLRNPVLDASLRFPTTHITRAISSSG